MNIFNDVNDSNKKLRGQIAGSKGVGYAEIFPNKNLDKSINYGDSRKYVIYTDGSSRGNPGPGGWAAVVISKIKSPTPLKLRGTGQISNLNEGEYVIEIGGREEMTTNNRMEMRAVIEGLKNTPEKSRVEIHADSEYVIKGATEWINNWQKNNWRTKAKKDVLNKDLWLAILAEMEKREVAWNKVAGHSGHFYNDRCDEIATSMADNLNIKLYSGPKSGYGVS